MPPGLKRCLALSECDDDGDQPYEDMTNPELQDLLEERGLSKSGNKAELVARLAEDDAADDGEDDEDE